MDVIQISAISFAFSQIVLSLLLLIGRLGISLAPKLYLLLLLAVVAHLSIPVAENAQWLWVPETIAIAIPGVFWLFSCCLFDDRFQLSAWRVGIVAFTIVLPFIAMICQWLGLHGFDFVLITIPQGVEFILLGLALYVVARNWNTDLVESRRSLRLWYCGIIGIYLFILIFLREVLFPDSEWLMPLQYLSIAIILLGANVMVLGYKANIWALLPPPTTEKDNASAYQNGLTEEPQEEVDPELVSRIDSLMERDKIYREMGLTIGQLAARLDLPEYRLRRLINAGLGYRNFNDFLNQYRIREASERLADPEQRNLQVLMIALDTGFRSLSSFNKAFKECHQLTPSAFRRERLKQLETGGGGSNKQASDSNVNRP